MNDFDEAAIYDFQVDVFRAAVSILNQGIVNGFKMEEIDYILEEFAKAYVRMVIHYTYNEDALLFELTKHTAFGRLREFLMEVDRKGSREKQLEKFTMIQNATTGMQRRFIKGTLDTRKRFLDVDIFTRSFFLTIANTFLLFPKALPLTSLTK